MTIRHLPIIALFLLIPGLALATPAAPGDNVNGSLKSATDMRMLSQRIVKAWAMIGQGVDQSDAELQLAESTAVFDLHLDDLDSAAADDSQLKLHLSATRSAWMNLKDLTSKPAHRDQALAVLRAANHTVTKIDTLLVQIQRATRQLPNRLVEVSDNQQMLSQRLAALYMLQAWGIRDESLDQQYQQATMDFSAGLERLLASSKNSRQIRRDLRLVSSQWSMFKRSANLSNDRYVPLLVNSASERILKAMDEVNGLYCEMAAKSSAKQAS